MGEIRRYSISLRVEGAALLSPLQGAHPKRWPQRQTPLITPSTSACRFSLLQCLAFSPGAPALSACAASLHQSQRRPLGTALPQLSPPRGQRLSVVCSSDGQRCDRPRLFVHVNGAEHLVVLCAMRSAMWNGTERCAAGDVGGYTVGTWPCFYLRMGVKVLDGQKGCDVEGSGLGRMVDRGGGGS